MTGHAGDGRGGVDRQVRDRLWLGLLEKAMTASGPFLERYSRLEEVRESNCSVVFAGHDRIAKRDVIVKILHPELDSDYWRDAFYREGEVLAGTADIPGVVQAFVTNRSTTVWVDGVPVNIVFHVLERGLHSFDDGYSPAADGAKATLRVFHGMCASVRGLHQHGVVHRDIKPSNFVAFPGHTVKIIDFTTSCFLDSPQLDDPTAHLSRYWYPFSPFHSAPELFCGLGRDRDRYRSADLWSLGATLYELWTGRTLMRELLPPDVRRQLLLRFRVLVPTRDREREYLGMLGELTRRHALPTLVVPESEAEADPAVDLIDSIYRSLAAFDWRERPTDLTSTMVAIEALLRQEA